MLAWLNVWPIQEVRRDADEAGLLLAITAHHAEHYNTVGLAVGWAATYLREEVLGTPDEMERRGLMRAARDVWRLRDLVRSARAGIYNVESDGNQLHFEFAQDPRIEALDNLLDLASDLQDAETLRSRMRSTVPMQELREYVGVSGASVSWESVENSIKDGFRTAAEVMVSGMRRVSALDSLSVGEFKLGEALSVWQELLAVALYRNLCMQAGAVNPMVTAPARTQAELLHDLAPSGVPDSSLKPIIEFLAFDPQRDEDPCLTPLISTTHGLVAMSSLIVPASPERNILAKARQNPASFGEIGNHIGDIGPFSVRQALERVPNTRVITKVPVRKLDGQSLGDLDVVALDVADKVIAIFEVKWQLDPDGAKELDKAEQQAEAGQAQIRRLRPFVESGQAGTRWPTDWPDLDDFEWYWFVITGNVIPMARAKVGDVPARSNRILTMMALREGAHLREVCNLFASPTLPTEGEQFIVETSEERVGFYVISVRRPS
ncbi:MAG: hypothetical protein WD757_03135 [Actinomycetota bacterium]